MQLKSQQKEELQFQVCAITVLGYQRVHSRLHLQGFGPRQVVAGDDPGVQDAAVLVDPPRGPPVPAAAGHTEQVALLEGQLVRVPGLKGPQRRVDGAALRSSLLELSRTRWSLLLPAAAPSSSSSSSVCSRRLLVVENPLP